MPEEIEVLRIIVFAFTFPVLAVAACTATAAPTAQRAQNPANPAAAESPRPAFAASAVDGSVGHAAAAPVAQNRHEHTTATPGATVYTCPMHPEVRAAEPGTCPKCGMTLEPIADPPRQP